MLRKKIEAIKENLDSQIKYEESNLNEPQLVVLVF